MLIHAMAAGESLMPERTVVVAGHEAEAVRKAALAHDVLQGGTEAQNESHRNQQRSLPVSRHRVSR